MKEKDFDRQFVESEDITEYPDPSKVRLVRHEQNRVNLNFPIWMIESLDRKASRLGITRQSIKKICLDERLEHVSANQAIQPTREARG